jgi:hypothetical protein
VVVVAGVVLVGVAVEEPPDLPPHPATARVVARAATNVKIVVSDVLFMGRVAILARGFRPRPGLPYQPLMASITVVC